jgi:hypothetical protein
MAARRVGQQQEAARALGELDQWRDRLRRRDLALTRVQAAREPRILVENPYQY